MAIELLVSCHILQNMHWALPKWQAPKPEHPYNPTPSSITPKHKFEQTRLRCSGYTNFVRGMHVVVDANDCGLVGLCHMVDVGSRVAPLPTLIVVSCQKAYGDRVSSSGRMSMACGACMYWWVGELTYRIAPCITVETACDCGSSYACMDMQYGDCM